MARELAGQWFVRLAGRKNVQVDDSSEALDPVSGLRRDQAFGYDCSQCGRCCRDKRVPLNPYEILLLARALGQSTTDFLVSHVLPNWPVLRQRSNGECVLLDNGRCSAHDARPLACRLYPLAVTRQMGGEERFERLTPRLYANGRFNESFSLDTWLDTQGCAEALQAADRYHALYRRVLESAGALLGQRPPPGAGAYWVGLTDSGIDDGFDDQVDAPHLPGFPAWFDIDAVVSGYCPRLGLEVPTSTGGLVDMHIRAVYDWLDALSHDD